MFILSPSLTEVKIFILYNVHDTSTRKLTDRWISPPQKGICKTVRNARLTGFQTMYTIKSALDLVGSNMISIDLGSSSFTMVVKHSFVRYT